MAHVVSRPGARFEIRESVTTARGPRARTLATFKELTPEVIELARSRATTPFDGAAVARSARRAGARAVRAEPDRLAEELIREIARGHLPRSGLARALRDMLEPGAADESFTEWIGATPAERGEALVQLLGLADRLPHRAPGDLTFPGLQRARRAG